MDYGGVPTYMWAYHPSLRLITPPSWSVNWKRGYVLVAPIRIPLAIDEKEGCPPRPPPPPPPPPLHPSPKTFGSIDAFDPARDPNFPPSPPPSCSSIRSRDVRAWKGLNRSQPKSSSAPLSKHSLIETPIIGDVILPVASSDLMACVD